MALRLKSPTILTKPKWHWFLDVQDRMMGSTLWVPRQWRGWKPRWGDAIQHTRFCHPGLEGSKSRFICVTSRSCAFGFGGGHDGVGAGRNVRSSAEPVPTPDRYTPWLTWTEVKVNTSASWRQAGVGTQRWSDTNKPILTGIFQCH